MDSQKIQSYFLEKRLEVLILADMGCHGLAQRRKFYFTWKLQLFDIEC